ncbi:MAG TPA: hypothetical protein VMD05_03535 [Candidatus Nanoarchaeia archaeon]|nr:hypothetical protein [Candidatus Nanoarchaeia archaeon]
MNTRKELTDKEEYSYGCDVLSDSLSKASEWVYRIFDRRTISIKAKNDKVRKIAAVDLATNLSFAIDVPMEVSLESLEVSKEYFASIKVYTAQNTEAAPPGAAEFFKVVDVDRPMDEFIKAYWLYPKMIKFELVEFEST